MPSRTCQGDPLCSEPAVAKGRCRLHAAVESAVQHPNKRFYNSKKWALTRRRQLAEHPLCQCPDPDCQGVATDVDHVTALEDGGAPFSPSNLQSLTGPCHARKTRQEQLAGTGASIRSG